MPINVPTLHEQIIAPTTPDNPRNGEGSIVALGDGRLLLGWSRFLGLQDHASGEICSRRSEDGGYTWGAPFLLQPNVGTCNVMSVSLLRLRSGDLLMGYLVKHHESKDCRFYVRRSADAGLTWDTPVWAAPEEGYLAVNNDRLIQTASGRILAPTGKCLEPDYHALSTCFYSDDDGRTWQRSAAWLDLPGAVGADEPGVVECADGSLWLYVRTDKGYIYASRSPDAGEHWPALEPTALIAPTSPSSAARLPASGDIVMIYNDRRGVPFSATGRPFQRRTPLTAAVSHDGGRTWGQHKLVEGDESLAYCYTSIAFHGNNTLLTYYVGPVDGYTCLLDLKLKIVPTVAWTK